MSTIINSSNNNIDIEEFYRKLFEHCEIDSFYSDEKFYKELNDNTFFNLTNKQVIIDNYEELKKDIIISYDENLKKFRELINSIPKEYIINPHKGVQPLHVAAFHGAYSIADILYSNGADLHATTNELSYNGVGISNSNPLIIATIFQKYLFVDWAISKGADIHFEFTDKGHGLLFAAATSGSLYMVNKIMEYGVKKEISNDGDTLFMWSCYSTYIQLTRFCIETNESINRTNQDNQTALFFASINPKVETLKLLLENGADPNIKDIHGKTAYDYAIEYKIKDTAEILSKVTNIKIYN